MEIKAKFSPLVIAQIDHMVKIRPDKEWSGIIFYKILENSENISFEIRSLIIMDLGTVVHTQFKETDPYISKYRNAHNELVNCYMGLLHSHHHMWNTPPSPEDDMTMRKEAYAKDRTNFLSIVVYNDRSVKPYSVRLTRILSEKTETKTTVVETVETSTNHFGKIVNLGTSVSTKEPITNPIESKKAEILNIDWKNCEIAAPSWGDCKEEEDENKTEFFDRIKEVEKIDNTKIVTTATKFNYKNYNSHNNFGLGSDYDIDDDFDVPSWQYSPTAGVYDSEASYSMSIEERRKHYTTLLHNLLTFSLVNFRNDFIRESFVKNEIEKFESRVENIFLTTKNFKKLSTKIFLDIITTYAGYFKNKQYDKEFASNILKAIDVLKNRIGYIEHVKFCLEDFIKKNRIKV